MLKRHSRTIKFVVIALAFAALAACGEAGERTIPAGWVELKIEGSRGYRTAVAGLDGRAIWVLTCPTDVPPDVERTGYVTGINTIDRSQTRIALQAPCAGGTVGSVGVAADQLALSASGFLIGVAGKSVFAYDTTSEQSAVIEAVIPPSADVIPDIPLAGIPTGVAISGERAWISVAGSAVLKGWDWVKNDWRDLPVSPLRVDEGSVRSLTGGAIALAGRLPATAEYRIGLVAPLSMKTDITMISSRRFAVLSGKTIAYFNQEGRLTLYDSEGKATQSTGPKLAAPKGVGAAFWSIDADPAAGADGSIWFADYSTLDEGKASLLKIVPTTGDLERTPLPDVKRDAGQRWRAPHGRLLFDSENRPWLLNAEFGAGQADLYLMTEAP